MLGSHFSSRVAGSPETLACFGAECGVDLVAIVRVGEAYFEYIKPVCVFMTFYNDGFWAGEPKHNDNSEPKRGNQWISRRKCLDRAVPIAGVACCGATGCPNTASNSIKKKFGDCTALEGTSSMGKRCKKWAKKTQEYCKFSCARDGFPFDDTCGEGASAQPYSFSSAHTCEYKEQLVRYSIAEAKCSALGLEVRIGAILN